MVTVLWYLIGNLNLVVGPTIFPLGSLVLYARDEKSEIVLHYPISTHRNNVTLFEIFMYMYTSRETLRDSVRIHCLLSTSPVNFSPLTNDTGHHTQTTESD